MGAKPCCTSSPTGFESPGADEPIKDFGTGDNLVESQKVLHSEVIEELDKSLVTLAETPTASAQAVDEESHRHERDEAKENEVVNEQEREGKLEAVQAAQSEEDEMRKKEEEEQERRRIEEEQEMKRKEEAEKKKQAAAEKKKKAEEKKKKAAEEAERKKKAAEEEKKKEAELKKLMAEAGVHFCKAAQSGKTKTLNLLLEAKANPDEQDSKGRRPLQVAILEGNTAIVKLLLDNKANPNLSGTGIQTGATYPLHVAARDDHNVEITTLLLQAGADANLKNQRNQTAELVAEGKRHTHVVAAIRKFKEDKLKDLVK